MSQINSGIAYNQTLQKMSGLRTPAPPTPNPLEGIAQLIAAAGTVASGSDVPMQFMQNRRQQILESTFLDAERVRQESDLLRNQLHGQLAVGQQSLLEKQYQREEEDRPLQRRKLAAETTEAELRTKALPGQLDEEATVRKLQQRKAGVDVGLAEATLLDSIREQSNRARESEIRLKTASTEADVESIKLDLIKSEQGVKKLLNEYVSDLFDTDPIKATLLFQGNLHESIKNGTTKDLSEAIEDHRKNDRDLVGLEKEIGYRRATDKILAATNPNASDFRKTADLVGTSELHKILGPTNETEMAVWNTDDETKEPFIDTQANQKRYLFGDGKKIKGILNSLTQDIIEGMIDSGELPDYIQDLQRLTPSYTEEQIEALVMKKHYPNYKTSLDKENEDSRSMLTFPGSGF